MPRGFEFECILRFVVQTTKLDQEESFTPQGLWSLFFCFLYFYNFCNNNTVPPVLNVCFQKFVGTQTVLNGLGPIKRLLGKCFQTSMSLTDGKFSRRKQWIMSSELRWDEAAWCLASSSSPGVHLSSDVCPQSMRWMTGACDDNNVLLRGQEKHSICQTSHDPWTHVYFLPTETFTFFECSQIQI